MVNLSASEISPDKRDYLWKSGFIREGVIWRSGIIRGGYCTNTFVLEIICLRNIF